MKSLFVYISVVLALFFIFGCRKSSSIGRKPLHSKTEKMEVRSELPCNHKEELPKKSQEQVERTMYSGSEIFEKYNTAVFMVFTSDGISRYQGSGFFINDRGLAVSNYHVFEGTRIGEERIKLSDSDSIYSIAEFFIRSKKNDFILFRVDINKSNYIPLAEEKPRIGERVYAIGSPRGLENTFSSGEISQWRDEYLIQINALIDHGSSGGALINAYGEVVGITSGSFYDGSQANLNYAWSIDVIKPYMRE